VAAGQEGGAGGDFNLRAHGFDETVADEDGSVVEGGIRGRNADAGVLNGERAVAEPERRMRCVAGENLKSPENTASHHKEKKYEENETKDPAVHGDLTHSQHIRRERAAGSSHIGAFDGQALGQ
jgi:hypothetical protein